MRPFALIGRLKTADSPYVVNGSLGTFIGDGLAVLSNDILDLTGDLLVLQLRDGLVSRFLEC